MVHWIGLVAKPARVCPPIAPTSLVHWVCLLSAHPSPDRVLVPWFQGDGLSFLRGCCILAIGSEVLSVSLKTKKLRIAPAQSWKPAGS